MTLQNLLDSIDSIIKENSKKNECNLIASLRQKMEIMQLIENSAPYFDQKTTQKTLQQ